MCAASSKSPCADDIVTLLLNYSYDINATDSKGYSSLYHACKSGSLHVVRVLLSHKKCDINLGNQRGTTALSRCIVQNHQNTYDIVKLFLRRQDCDVNLINDRGESALHTSVIKQTIPVIELLLNDARCDVNLKSANGRTALKIAAASTAVDVVRVILKHPGIDVNAQDTDGEGPLNRTDWLKPSLIPEIVFSDPRYNVNLQNRSGQTVLMQVAKSKAVREQSLQKLFLDHPDCDVNKADNHGETALHYACKNKNTNSCLLIIKHPKCDISISNSEGQTSFFVFLERMDFFKDSTEKLKSLLSAFMAHTKFSACCTTRSAEGLSPFDWYLMQTRVFGHYFKICPNTDEYLKLLLKSKELCSATPDTLAIAMTHCPHDVCRQIVSHTNVNSCLPDNETALHYAVQWNSVNKVKSIMEYNPRLDIEWRGLTPFQLALAYGCSTDIMLLLSKIMPMTEIVEDIKKCSIVDESIHDAVVRLGVPSWIEYVEDNMDIAKRAKREEATEPAGNGMSERMPDSITCDRPGKVTDSMEDTKPEEEQDSVEIAPLGNKCVSLGIITNMLDYSGLEGAANRAEDSRSEGVTNRAEDSRSEEVANIVNKSRSEEVTNRVDESRSEKVTNRVDNSRLEKVTNMVEDSRSEEVTNRVYVSRSEEVTKKVEESISAEVTKRVEETRSTEVTNRVEDFRSEEVINREDDSRSEEVTHRVDKSRSEEVTNRVDGLKSEEVTNRVEDSRSEEPTTVDASRSEKVVNRVDDSKSEKVTESEENIMPVKVNDSVVSMKPEKMRDSFETIEPSEKMNAVDSARQEKVTNKVDESRADKVTESVGNSMPDRLNDSGECVRKKKVMHSLEIVKPKKVTISTEDARPEKITGSVDGAKVKKSISVKIARPEKLTESVEKARLEKVTESIENVLPVAGSKESVKSKKEVYSLEIARQEIVTDTVENSRSEKVTESIKNTRAENGQDSVERLGPEAVKDSLEDYRIKKVSCMIEVSGQEEVTDMEEYSRSEKVATMVEDSRPEKVTDTVEDSRQEKVTDTEEDSRQEKVADMVGDSRSDQVTITVEDSRSEKITVTIEDSRSEKIAVTVEDSRSEKVTAPVEGIAGSEEIEDSMSKVNQGKLMDSVAVVMSEKVMDAFERSRPEKTVGSTEDVTGKNLMNSLESVCHEKITDSIEPGTPEKEPDFVEGARPPYVMGSVEKTILEEVGSSGSTGPQMAVAAELPTPETITHSLESDRSDKGNDSVQSSETETCVLWPFLKKNCGSKLRIGKVENETGGEEEVIVLQVLRNYRTLLEKHQTEVEMVKHCVQSLILRISQVMSNKENSSHMAFVPVLSGSMRENTKCYAPNEVDTICRFINTDGLTITGNFHATEIRCHNVKGWRELCSFGNYLDPRKVAKAFYGFIDDGLCVIVSGKESFGNLHLFKFSLKILKKISCLRLLWRGEVFENMIVNVDLVPAFARPPPKQPLPFGIQCDEFYALAKTSRHDSRSHRYFLTSFCQAEHKIFNQLPTEVRDGYTFAKAVRLELVYRRWFTDSCRRYLGVQENISVEDVITSYVLKTCLLNILKKYETGSPSDERPSCKHAWADAIYRELHRTVRAKKLIPWYKTNPMMWSCGKCPLGNINTCCRKRKLIQELADKTRQWLRQHMDTICDCQA